MMSMTRQQRGATLMGMLTWAIVLIFLAIGGMKVVPAYVQDRTIKGILDTLAHDPELQGAQLKDVKDAFWKRATTMNNITVISADDLIAEKLPGGWSLRVSYNVKIPIVANASLLLEFDTSSK